MLFQVTIIASDNGNQRLTSSALLNVTILDQNDNAPILLPCGEQGNKLSVKENAPIGSYIGNIVAIDADSGRNGEIIFRLLNRMTSSRFELLPNGTLYTAMPLDREEKVSIQFRAFVFTFSMITSYCSISIS